MDRNSSKDESEGYSSTDEYYESFLDSDGLPRSKKPIEQNDVICGKIGSSSAQKSKQQRRKAMKCKQWDKILDNDPNKKFTFPELSNFIAVGSEIMVDWKQTGFWIGAEITMVLTKSTTRRSKSGSVKKRASNPKKPISFIYSYWMKEDDEFVLETETITIKPFVGKMDTKMLGFNFVSSKEKDELAESIKSLIDYKIEGPKDRTREGKHCEFVVQIQNNFSKRNLSGTFIVDKVAYNNWNDGPNGRDVDDGHWHPSPRRRYGLRSSVIDRMDQLPESKFWLLCPFVIAFHLPSRTWGFLNFSETKIPSYTNKAWDNLVIDEKRKKMLESVVRCTDPTSDRICDFVSNKGLGLNLLFHGPSGCGKTLTAQALSNLHQKAVFNISAGDLGSDIGTVEHQLRFISNVVARWSIYVQIDECDLFISARENVNLVLNELTCCFLRFLETHATIVFLTTNMNIKTIDPAIRTRIHCFLEFTDLTLADRKHVWENLLQIYEITEKKDVQKFIDEFASYCLNGREVRNILYLARAIATDDKRSKLCVKDVKDAMQMALLTPPSLDHLYT